MAKLNFKSKDNPGGFPYKEKSFLDVTTDEENNINEIPESISKQSKVANSITFGRLPFNRESMNKDLKEGRTDKFYSSFWNPTTNTVEQKSVVNAAAVPQKSTTSSSTTKTNTSSPASAPPKEEKKPVKQDELLTEMDKIRKQQMAVDLSDVGFNLANMLGEAMRGPSEGFKAPAMGQYTLMPNQREVMINQGMADIAGQEAATLRFMQENGMIPVAPGLQANSLDAKQKLLANAGQLQAQIDAKNVEIIDKARSAQGAAEAEVEKNNILKQAQENAISGQVIGQSWNNIMAGLSDINRNDLENEKVKALMGSKNNSSLYVSNLMQQSFPWMYRNNYRRNPRFGNYSYGYESGYGY